jgi:5-methylcytosine-specific restriction endonuclease McrA
MAGKSPINDSRRNAKYREIFDKTGGVCHVCGDPLVLDQVGRGGNSKGVYDVPPGWWEVDHIFQRSRGGASSAANSLPACTPCNRARWHRQGAYARVTLLLGLAARELICRGGEPGKAVLAEAGARWSYMKKWPELGKRKTKGRKS